MAKINTLNYQTIASWNGSQDLFVVEQPDGTKVATPAMVKQFIEAGDFEATGEVKDGHGNKLADMAKSADVDVALADKVEASSIDGDCNGVMVKVSDSRMILMIQNGGSATGNKNMRIDLQTDKLRWQIFQNNAWNTIKQASWEESGDITQTLFDTNRISVTSQNFKYKKIGNIVTVYGSVTFGAKVTTSGNYVFANRLPYNSNQLSLVVGKMVSTTGTVTPYEAVSANASGGSVWFSYNGVGELKTSDFENKTFNLFLQYLVS